MCPFRRIAAAAAIILISLGTYFYFKPARPETTTAKTEKPATIHDATPGSNKPILILSGGQQIVLDSNQNKTIATLANTKIVQSNNSDIAYERTNADGPTTKNPVAVPEYNTLNNPRGSNVTTITLSDGTKVWLNAGSSLTYPVTFTDKERSVEITGEAYFEVTKNPHAPFTVKKHNSDTRITVLGTHFNVNTYDDEAENKITLLEGSIKLSTANNNQILKPGQQASVKNNNIKLESSVDLNATMAWKNGQFVLKGTDLATLLRQIGRWYDVNIEYRNKIPAKKFGGSISRNVNLSTVMEALQENGVNCSLNNKILTVD